MMIPSVCVLAVMSLQLPGPCTPNWPAARKLLVGDWSLIKITGEPDVDPNQEIAWDALKVYADTTEPVVDVSVPIDYQTWPMFNLDYNHDVWTMANAVVYAGNDDTYYRDRALNGLSLAASLDSYDPATVSVIPTCRNTLAYVLAADTIDLGATSATVYADFRDWIDTLHTVSNWAANNGVQNHGCKNLTIAECHDDRPNNHGTYCGASAIAIEIYLRHTNHLCNRVKTYRGFMGDTSQYSGFQWTGADMSWHVDPMNPKPVNPECDPTCPGGHDIGGVVPDDARRVSDADCGFGQYPGAWPHTTGYAWETTQGLVMQAHLLSRAGFSSYTWSSSAMRRVISWLYDEYSFPPEETPECGGASGMDDSWVPHITQRIYTSNHALFYPAAKGKNCVGADWWAFGL